MGVGVSRYPRPKRNTARAAFAAISRNTLGTVNAGGDELRSNIE